MRTSEKSPCEANTGMSVSGLLSFFSPPSKPSLPPGGGDNFPSGGAYGPTFLDSDLAPDTKSSSAMPIAEPVPASSAPSRKVLGTVAFAFIAVQLVAGGPWGLEESVREAGPGPVLLAMILLPLTFALPQALMTAELASLCVTSVLVWDCSLSVFFHAYAVVM